MTYTTQRIILRLGLSFIALIFLGNPFTHQPLLARSLVHESFHADIRVFPDGKLEVTETIRTRFEGSWNGLYRFIPVQYVTPQGFSYKLRLELESITDELMRPLRYETTSERHFRKFTIWIPGAQDAIRTVVIRYRVGFGLRFLDDYDELYWNVTGDEDLVPIEVASARIQLPSEVTGTRGVAFTGGVRLRGTGSPGPGGRTDGHHPGTQRAEHSRRSHRGGGMGYGNHPQTRRE